MTPYLAVLRWKRAERGALRKLDRDTRRLIRPLIEPVPRDFGRLAECSGVGPTLDQTILQIGKDWGPSEALIDLSLVRPLLKGMSTGSAFDAIVRSSTERSMNLVPVARMHDLIEPLPRRIAIRVTRSELQDTADVAKTLKSLHLSPDSIDLIVDLGCITAQVDRTDIPCTPRLKRIPWRSLTILSGAFPKDLRQFEKNRQHTHPRHDWLYWQRVAQSKYGALFGDYTIQHPVFGEPPARANFSASIRYTAPSDWVIMRGEGVRNEDGPGYAQWPANARLLVERKEFCGEQFSFGDWYITELASARVNTGNAETWLRAGINHHLTFVARQVANSAQ